MKPKVFPNVSHTFFSRLNFRQLNYCSNKKSNSPGTKLYRECKFLVPSQNTHSTNFHLNPYEVLLRPWIASDICLDLPLAAFAPSLILRNSANFFPLIEYCRIRLHFFWWISVIRFWVLLTLIAGAPLPACHINPPAVRYLPAIALPIEDSFMPDFTEASIALL